MKKYRITLTEKQMRIIQDVCELRVRIDLCQDYELSEILATMNDLDLSIDNPNHKKIFDAYIDRREHLKAVINCMYEIANPWSLRTSSLRKRDKTSLECETLWVSIRHKLWENNPNKDEIGYVVDSNAPMQMGGEPIPEIEVLNE